MIKLAQWAKSKGISYRKALRLAEDGRLSCVMDKHGTLFVDVKTAAIPVPPRRGERGKKMFVKRAVKALSEAEKDLSEAWDLLVSVSESTDDGWYLSDLFDILGYDSHEAYYAREEITRKIAEVKFYANTFFRKSEDDIDFFQAYLNVKNALKFRDAWGNSQSIFGDEDIYPEAFLKAFLSDGAQKIAEENDLAWNPEFESGIRPETMKAIKEIARAANKLKYVSEKIKDRLEAEAIAESSRPKMPKKFEDTEKLYHASIHAKKLFDKGFDRVVPDQEGIGGSQSAGGGVEGTSFTYDLYVAKEIARVLKELALIAQGSVTAKDVTLWINHDKVAKKVVAQGMNLPSGWRMKERGGKLVFYNPKGEPSDPRLAIKDPESVAWLYKLYLQSIRNLRYDPYVMNPQNIIRALKKVDPRGIGVVEATVDMNDPNILHVGGERELRVPPEAILSVDRFIR